MSVIDELPEGCILGLNYSGLHDSAITIVDPDGRPAFACALERISRVKQDGRWPKALLDMVPWSKIRAVAIPALTHEDATRLGVDGGIAGWPLPAAGGQLSVSRSAPRLQGLLDTLPVPVMRFDHHQAHAASAWHLAGYEEGLVLTCDGGAAACPWTGAAYRGSGDRLELLGGMSHGAFWSPTAAYAMITALIGLRPNLHEGKVTGLAARGDASPARLAEFCRIAEPLIPRTDQLLYWAFTDRADRPARLVVNPVVRRQWRALFADFGDADLAACVQKYAETAALAMLDNAIEQAGARPPNLCLAGGLFANVRINQVLIGRGFESGFVAPPMTDDGVSFGAALLGWRQIHPERRRVIGHTTMFLGPDLTESAVESALEQAGVTAARPTDLADTVATHLLAGRTVAVARGRMEFGPRALGNRSILSRTADEGINDALNARLRRTEYMPFAPVLQAADADDHLQGAGPIASAGRFMTVTADCRASLAKACPAVVHVDGTARPQFVGPDDAPFLDAVITSFRSRGGEPAILNTSFNIHEEPIVCSVDDALMGFATAKLDVLVLGERLVDRAGNEAALDRIAARHEPPPRFTNEDLIEALSEWAQTSAANLSNALRAAVAVSATAPPLAPIVPGVHPSELAKAERDLALARLEIEAHSRELKRVQASKALRAAKSAGRLLDAATRGLLGTARSAAAFTWRRLPARTRADLSRRIAEGTLPRPLQALVRRLEPRAVLGVSTSPFDKIDRIFTREPRVSVVVPCFNQGELLQETLASLQRQTFPFFEVIVVDDGSTDPVTRAVLDDLRWPGLDIRVIRQTNGGPAKARNVGIQQARAALILPLDADDLLDPACMMQMVALLDQRKDLGIAYCDIRFFGEKNGVGACPEYDLNALLDENFMVVTSMFRKTLWASVGGYNEQLQYGYEDWCLWIDFAAIGWYGKRIPAPLFHYRIKAASRNVTAVANNKILIAQIRERHAALYADTRLQAMWRERTVWVDPRPQAAPDATERPLVTVVIPCFNYGRYLDDAIRSALAQTYENVEVLVLDDGSTDPATIELLRTRSWPRTTVVRHDNMGLAATRNRGFELAKGEYVVPLDADDMLLPEMVEKCLRVLRADRGTGWVYTDIRFFDHQNAVHRQEDYNLALELTNNHSSVCAMIRKSAWRAAGGYNPKMKVMGYEDWDFWVACSERGWHGKLADGPLFAYRLHGVSMITTSLQHHQTLENEIRQKHPLLYLPWNVEAIRAEWLPRIVDRRHLPPVAYGEPAAPYVPTAGRVLFSIVVPVYRHDVYLRQCIESALQQTLQDFELLLIDDGSQSPSITRILAEFANDPRVHILVNDRNRGIAFSLNRAIIASRGDYIAFLDCDDFLVPEALAKVAAFLRQGAIKHYVTSQILDVDEAGAVIRKRTRPETPNDFHRGMFGGHLKVVRRGAFERIGLLDEDASGCQDYELLLRLQETYPVHFLQEYLYCYRWHGATVSVTRQAEQDALVTRLANDTRYRRWLFDDHARKGAYECVCVLVVDGSKAAAVLPTLRAATGLPLVVAIEEAPGICTVYRSERRSEALRSSSRGVTTDLDSLATASGARWITCLRPGMQVEKGWLENLYFLLTTKTSQGIAPLVLDGTRRRTVSAGLAREADTLVPRAAGRPPEDLEALRIIRCDGAPLWGSLFPIEHLRARLGGDRRLHAGLADSIVAAASTTDDRYYVQPVARVERDAAATADATASSAAAAS